MINLVKKLRVLYIDTCNRHPFLTLFGKVIFIGTPICYTISDTVAYIAPVSGKSMRPIINQSENEQNEEVLLFWHLPIRFNFIKRGDVVTMISPRKPDEVIIKRVIGLPGDHVKTISYKKSIVKVPMGHCWVEGDNYNQSYDSNMFGVVPMGLLLHKAGYIIWPFKRFSKITNEIPKKRRLIPLNNDFNENSEKSYYIDYISD